MASPSFGKFLKDNVKGYGEPFLALDAVSIANSDNKLKALSKTLFDLTTWKVTFPAAIIGGIMGIQKAVRSLADNTGSLDAAMGKIAKIKFYTGQLEPLVKGAANARARLAELMQFERRSPFNLGQIVAASRALHIFSNGVLGTTQSLKKVEDIARASGTGIEDAAFAYGNFYRALKGGAPIREFSSTLEGMGVISQKAISQLEEMQERGASWSQVFASAATVIAENTSHTENFSESMEGLRKKLAETREEMGATFGKPFMEQERKGMESAIVIAQNLTPALEALSVPLGRIGSFTSNVKNKVKESVSGAIGSAAPIAGGAGNLLESGLEIGGTVATGYTVFNSMKLGGALKSGYSAVTSGASSGLSFVGALISKATNVPIGPRNLHGVFEGETMLQSAGYRASGITGMLSNIAKAPFASIAKGFGMIVKAMGPIGLAITIGTSVKAAIDTVADSMNTQAKSAMDLMNAHQQAEAAIHSQVKTATTAEDAFSALAAAQDLVTESVEKLARTKPPTWWQRMTGQNTQQIAQANVWKAQAVMREAQGAVNVGYISDVERNNINSRAERELQLYQAQQQNETELTSGSQKVGRLGLSKFIASEQGRAGEEYQDDMPNVITQSQALHDDDAKYNNEVKKASDKVTSVNQKTGTDWRTRKSQAQARAELVKAKENKRQHDEDIQDKEVSFMTESPSELMREQGRILQETYALNRKKNSKEGMNPNEYAQKSRDLAAEAANVGVRIKDYDPFKKKGEALQYGTEQTQEQWAVNLTNIKLKSEKEISKIKTSGFSAEREEYKIKQTEYSETANELDAQGKHELAFSQRTAQAEAQKQERDKEIQRKKEEASLVAQENIGKSKDIGIAREKLSFEENQKALKAQAQLEESVGGPNEISRSIRAQMSQNAFERSQQVHEEAATAAGSKFELARTRALAGLGPTVDLAHLDHEQRVGEIYESKHGEMGNAKAREYAVSMVEAQTRAQDMQTMAGQSAVVDSLQEIGGGGNVANQGVSMADILKDSKDIQEAMRDYLAEIAQQEGTLK